MSNTQFADDLPKQMKAAQLHEFKKPYSIDTIDVPRDLPDYGILLKTAVASYCHTDAMVMNGEMGVLVPKPPGCAGSHEPTGTVVGLGSEASKLGFKLKDRIAAIGTFGYCGKCDECKGPEENRHFCTNLKGFVGVGLPGGFEEYVVVDARSATVVPDTLSFQSAAPLTCAGVTAWRAVVIAERELKKGDWIGMVGSGGGLGHLGIQFAAKKGYKVVGLDTRKQALELSKEAGADAVIDASIGKEKVVEEIKKVTGGSLLSTSIIFSDNDEAAPLACAITAMHKTVVLVAQPQTVAIPYNEFIFRDIRLVGSLLSSANQFADMMKFVHEEKVKVRTKAYDGLESLPQVVDDAHNGKYAGKLVVNIDKAAVEEDEKHKRI